jgi:quercetin dioxygenase-like cupin family protein
VQHWNLLEIEAPNGTRDPIVVHQDDGARAILVVLQPGQRLGEHQVRENAWVYVVDGAVQVASDAETIEAGPGGLLRFEPAERHSLSANSGARILLMLTPWPGEGHFPAR